MPVRVQSQFRDGTARWAKTHELRRVGLFQAQGHFLGFHRGRALRLTSDSPIIKFGGAGSGKLRDSLAYIVCRSPGIPMLIMDPRGELWDISFAQHARHNEYAWRWSPGSGANPSNPLCILRLDSEYLFTDLQFLICAIVVFSGGGNAQYFEQRVQDWLGAIALSHVERFNEVSFPDLYRVMCIIEGDPEAWANELEAMLASRFEDVRRVASEMLSKQQDAEKEFGSIMGQMYASLGFLADPALRASLEGERSTSSSRARHFSLDVLVDPKRVSKVFLNVPAEHMSVLAPVLRTFFAVALLLKARNPSARRVHFVVDEAGQLGRFDALLQAFTYGRGAGVRVAPAVFQDIGQIARNFGPAAISSFLGSAQVRQFFGVRDYETANLISKMLGTQTFSYDDELRQSQARRDRRRAAFEMMSSDDPWGATADYVHASFAEQQKTQQPRSLMMPEEILNMPENKQILFISGLNLPPILADKHPYYERRDMAGHYLPNKYHPPTDRVRVQTWLGPRWRDIRHGAVPAHLRDYPQFDGRDLSWVEGYPIH